METEAKEAVKFLLERDYENISRFRNGHIGVTFIPAVPVPPVSHWQRNVDPDNLTSRQEFQALTSYLDPVKDAKLLKELEEAYKHTPGYFCEKMVYEVLKDYFKDSTENVVVMHGIDLQGIQFVQFYKMAMMSCMIFFILDATSLGARKGGEFDFLIINETRQYIFNLEVKKSLIPEAISKAAEQVCKNQGLFEHFFGASLKGEKWKYVRAVAYRSENPQLQHTDDGNCKCEDFVVHLSKIAQLMRAIEGQCPPIIDQEKVAEDLICIVQNLLFCLPTKEVLVKSSLYDPMSAALRKQGEIDTIRLYFPTPVQQSIQRSHFLGNYFITKWHLLS